MCYVPNKYPVARGGRDRDRDRGPRANEQHTLPVTTRLLGEVQPWRHSESLIDSGSALCAVDKLITGNFKDVRAKNFSVSLSCSTRRLATASRSTVTKSSFYSISKKNLRRNHKTFQS